jgi:DNA-binding transcriptional LysR family regulator
MDLKLLDDLIAVAESKSLSAAAIRRNVTQPAFTRRLQSIEKALGIQVIKKGSKPARPSDTLLQNIDEIRTLAYSLRRLGHDLIDSASPDRNLAIAALHAIALAHLPEAMMRLNRILPLSRLRLHAANRDECFIGLMTGQVRIMIRL